MLSEVISFFVKSISRNFSDLIGGKGVQCYFARSAYPAILLNYGAIFIAPSQYKCCNFIAPFKHTHTEESQLEISL